MEFETLGYCIFPVLKRILFTIIICFQEIEIWPYHLRAPSNISSLTIRNCDAVTLVMHCNKHSQLKNLHIVDVINLKIISDEFTQNPQEIHFENITWIEEIPANAFTQISRRKAPAICELQYYDNDDLESIVFRNVNIGTINARAFFHLENMKTFSLYSVKIHKIKTEGLHVRMRNPNKFIAYNCLIKKMERHAIFMGGRKLLIAENDFIEIVTNREKTICFNTSNVAVQS